VTDPEQMRRIVDLMKKKYLLARPYLWSRKQPDGAFHVRVADRRIALLSATRHQYA